MSWYASCCGAAADCEEESRGGALPRLCVLFPMLCFVGTDDLSSPLCAPSPTGGSTYLPCRAGSVCPAEECALSVRADRAAPPYRRSTQRRQKGKQHSQSKCCFLVGDGGFEPPKALPADLQSVPFGHSGNPPYTIWNWSWWTDSNPRPADYKSAALPAELHQHNNQRILCYHKGANLSIKKL